MPASPRTRPIALVVLAVFGGASLGCATAPLASVSLPPSFEQKLANIVRLEDQRVLADPVVPPPMPAPSRRDRRTAVVPPPPRIDDLTALLADDEGRVRRRAALAIGRVGIAAGVAPLSEALKDSDPEVREMAAFALGLIGDRASVPILAAALGDPDDRVQGRAAESLGLIGAGEPAAAIGQMIARHADAAASIDPDDLSPSHVPSVEAFRLGVFALVRLNAWEPLAAVVLAPGGEPRVPWWPVAFALQRLQDARAIPALLWFARQGGRESAAFAVRGLGLLEAAATSEPRSDLGVVSTLLRILESGDSDPRVVVAAVRSLGQIGDQRAAASLIKILQRPELDPSLRLEAVVALGVLRAPEAVGLLTDLTGASWAPLRGAAFTALAATDPESLMFVLSSLDADAAWTVRAELATALSSLDPEFALPRVRAMLKDSEVRVLPRVLEALVKLDAAGVDAVLVDHLSASDAVVRATAATLLGQRKPQAAAGPLEKAYEASKADATYVARAAILTALSKYDGGLAKNVLRDALADPDWAVRRRAAELLHAADPATDVSAIRPAPTRHSEADYANPALIAPPYSTHVYFETAKGTIEAELAVLDAPLTAANFVGLVRQGYYDGLTFHRVVPNFVIQGGDPRGDGEGGPGYTIRDEINTRPYLRGTLGMALDWADTGGSQFFITHGPQPHLDGRYTVFGHVVAGQEVVDRIVRGDVIERVRVWNGVEWIEGPPR